MALLTTTPGSFPKPRELRRARFKHAEGELDDRALRDVESKATEATVRLQEDLGLDVFVDGQMERGDMLGFFAERLDGMELAGLVRCWGNRYYRAPRIVDEIKRSESLTVEHWNAAQELTAKPVRAVLTGPYTLMDWSFDEHYGSREKCCRALADALRPELDELIVAGAKEIQFDEPAISGRPAEMGLLREALEHLVGDVAGRARIWLHLCFGDLLPVIGEVLTLPYNVLLLEQANSRYALLDALSALPQDRLLAAGVVDCIVPEVETADEIAGHVEKLLAGVPADRLMLTPDAGLRTLTEEQARAKLEAMISAASRF